MSTKDAAAEMRVAESTIRTWVQNGWLAIAGKVGGKNYYRRADVLKAELRARRGDVLADHS
jgi:DNA-binding transcriptional MerR regulator